MKRKNWVYKSTFSDREKIKNLSLKYSPVIASLLVNRGITEEDKINIYFNKPLSQILSPSLMDGMDVASERISKAIDENEKITIYGDYDVDGITSTVLLYRFLDGLGANVSYYIPERADEGYGLNMLAVNKLIKSGTKLLITVDCGITSVGEVEFAKLQGMDVIITDHHTCQEKLPKAIAVLNPKIPNSSYPFSGLAGVGVALKLALGVSVFRKMNTSAVFSEFSDLAAIGTIADLVPLTGENRVIVSRGLEKIKNGLAIVGINALIDICAIDKQNLTAGSIAYSLAPRLNASGRLGSATEAVELLLAKDYDKAVLLAKSLDEENTRRRITEQEIFTDAVSMIEEDADFPKKRVIVLSHESWHQGVIGIVASRLCEKYGKPAILISVDNGKGKGSGRSILAFNLFEALSECDDFLNSFGGHSVAAGLTINSENIEAFSAHINKYANSKLNDADLIPSVKIDCEIPSSAVTLKNTKFLSALEPFGMANETPVFSMCGVSVKAFSAIGTDKKHLKLTVLKDGNEFNCVGFCMGEYIPYLTTGAYIDIAFNMNINNFHNNELLQLRLKDIRI